MVEYVRTGLLFLMTVLMVGTSMFFVAHHTWYFVENQAVHARDEVHL